MNTAVLPFCCTSRTNSARRSRAVISSSDENGSSHSSMSRLDRERARDRDALAHAAGERMRIVVLVARRARAVPASAAPPSAPAWDRYRGFRRPSSTLPSAVRHGISRSFWNTMPILPRNALELAERIVAGHVDLAAGRLDQAGDQVEHGRLAAAGLAEHGDDLALRDLERQLVDREQVAAPVGAAEHLGHIAKSDDRVSHVLSFDSCAQLKSPARTPRGSAAAQLSIATMVCCTTSTNSTSWMVQASAPAMSNNCCWRRSS